MVVAIQFVRISSVASKTDVNGVVPLRCGYKKRAELLPAVCCRFFNFSELYVFLFPFCRSVAVILTFNLPVTCICILGAFLSVLPSAATLRAQRTLTFTPFRFNSV